MQLNKSSNKYCLLYRNPQSHTTQFYPNVNANVNCTNCIPTIAALQHSIATRIVHHTLLVLIQIPPNIILNIRTNLYATYG